MSRRKKMNERHDLQTLRRVIRGELRSTRGESINETAALLGQGLSALVAGWEAVPMLAKTAALGTLTQQIAKAVGSIFDDEADRALAQAIKADPRMADAAALYAAMKKRFGIDKITVKAVLDKNAHDLPGLADRYTNAAAVITGGNIGSAELVSDLQVEDMVAEAQKILDAITAKQSVVAQTPAAGQQMPQAPAPMPGVVGQPMSEARVRRAIRRELLKIL